MAKVTEEMEKHEIAQLVKKATYTGRITCFTRKFVRGTDFQVRDQLVIINGGCCGIQCFPSESDSEEIQTKGRSARQGQAGSFIQILNKEDLYKYLITDEDIESFRNNGNLYDEIRKKINSIYDSQFEDV